MEYYAILKHIHMACAGLTFVGFLIRGYWMIIESDMLQKKPIKILPHIIDSVLLLTAIIMVVLSGMYPFQVDWITIKVFLLVLYIVLGTIALKKGKTKKTRMITFALALVTILAIFATAGIKPSF